MPSSPVNPNGSAPAATGGGQSPASGQSRPTHAPDKAEFLYLSELLGAPVRREGETKPFGRLYDLGVRRVVTYPQTVCLDVETRGGRQTLPWSAVRRLSPRDVVVGAETDGAPPADFWIRRDVLDDQVVDVKGAKVRRVNDVHLLYAEGYLIIGHVEVGTLGILRRLHFDRAVNWLTRWLLDYEIKESFLGWRWIEVLSPGGSPGGLRVIGEPGRLADMAPAELADILEDLGTKERQTVFNSLSVEAAAGALEAVEPDLQRAIIAQQEPGKAADILEEMETTRAAGLLRDVSPSDAQQIISRMDTDASQEVRSVLRHEEATAGGVMEPSCVTASATDRAGEVLDHIHSAAEEPSILTAIYVLDGARRLVGVLSLRELLRAPEDAMLSGLMTAPVVSVRSDTRLRNVARIFVKYGFRNLPVVDENQVFLGAVRLRRVLGEIAPFLRE